MNGSASTTDFRARVGAMLAQARKEKGITQIQLAERLGTVSYTHLTLPTIA